MTNVLMVTKYFYPSLGGVETHVREISTRLAKRNYSIRIVAPSVQKGVSCDSVGDVDVLRFPVFSLNRIDFSPRMQSFVRTIRSDIVHFHTFELLCRAVRLWLRKGTPYCITTHGLIWDEAGNPLQSMLKTLGGAILRNNFINATKIFCVSRLDCATVMKIVGDKVSMRDRVVYLPNGVDAEKFHVSEKDKFGEKDAYRGKIVVTQIARFTPEKGQHVFLNAISKLRKRIPDNSIFLFVGYVQNQRYYLALQEEAKKRGLGKKVFFLPNATDEDLLRIYKDTDVLVLPSLAEGFPLNILEAWASRCSVIASKVGGIPYFLNDEVDSFLVPPNNSDVLSQKILDLVADKELRKRLAANGCGRAQREFSWNRVVDVISKEYDSMMG